MAFSVAFPPTWVVIDNGHPSDKEVSEKIVDYLMTKFPPVIAVRKEVPPKEEPDPLDFMFHGVIIVGGPACWWPGETKWHMKYLEAMDPGWENRGTEEAPIFWIVKREPKPYETIHEMACLISSTTGEFPWLSVWNVAGMSGYATVQAGELFREGERRGIWINKVKVADP